MRSRVVAASSLVKPTFTVEKSARVTKGLDRYSSHYPTSRISAFDVFRLALPSAEGRGLTTPPRLAKDAFAAGNAQGFAPGQAARQGPRLPLRSSASAGSGRNWFFALEFL
jgi:hypothetical protein